MTEKIRIALVEDNPDNRLLINAILSRRFAVDSYDNGPDALAAWNTEVPRLVLMDISLPGMDGVEILQKMKASDRLAGVPVIALTAHAMEGDRERFLLAGFDDYVAKPIVDVSILFNAIDALLA